MMMSFGFRENSSIVEGFSGLSLFSWYATELVLLLKFILD